jgi:hypothetical protein
MRLDALLLRCLRGTAAPSAVSAVRPTSGHATTHLPAPLLHQHHQPTPSNFSSSSSASSGKEGNLAGRLHEDATLRYYRAQGADVGPATFKTPKEPLDFLNDRNVPAQPQRLVSYLRNRLPDRLSALPPAMRPRLTASQITDDMLLNSFLGNQLLLSEALNQLGRSLRTTAQSVLEIDAIGVVDYNALRRHLLIIEAKFGSGNLNHGANQLALRDAYFNIIMAAACEMYLPIRVALAVPGGVRRHQSFINGPYGRCELDHVTDDKQ